MKKMSRQVPVPMIKVVKFNKIAYTFQRKYVSEIT